MVSPRARRALLLAIWILPIAGVAWWASKQQAPAFPHSGTGLAWLGAALALYALATLLRGERWDRILRRAGVNAKRADAYALVSVGYMGNNVLPARGGELLRTFLLGARTSSTKRTILGTIVAERLLDALALGVILVALAYDLLQRLQPPSTTVLLLGAVLAATAAATLAIALLRHRERLHFVLKALAPLAQPSKALLSPQGAFLLLVSLAIWCVEAAVYIAVARAATIHLGLQDGLAIVAFTNAAALIPAAPGYIGTYDAAVIFATRAVSSASRSAVLSYLLLLRFVLFVPITLAGLVLLVARYGGLQRVRAAWASARAAEAAAEPAPSAA
jgi:glycosyltransferase 2 family protein